MVVLCFGTTSAFAQNVSEEDATVLGKVIVTDTGQKIKLLDTNTSITILTEKDIKRSGQTSTISLITSMPGVVNQFDNIAIRGLRSSTSGGPAVYIDGRLLNKGLYDKPYLETIPLDSILKIEILRSPSPVLYGINAAKGVILITTKKNKRTEKDITANLKMEYGYWNTMKGIVAVYGNLYGLNYGLTGNALKTDGYRHTNKRNKDVSLNVGAPFDGGEVNFFAGISDAKHDSTGALDIAVAEKKPRTGAKYKASQNKKTNYNTGLNVKYDKNNWLLNSSFKYEYTDELYKNLNKSSVASKYEEDRNYSAYDGAINLGKIIPLGDSAIDTLSISLNYKYDSLENDRSYYTSTGSNTELKNDVDANRNMFGVGINNDFSYGIARLATGLKYNKVKYDLSSKLDSFKRNFGNDYEWNVSTSVVPMENSNLFINYSRSKVYGCLYYYKAGMEKAFPATMPENLKPETYDTIETGFKHQFNRALNYSIILYYAKVQDRFIAFYDAANTYRGYGNAGECVNKGIEIELDGKPIDLIGYRVGFSTIDSEWKKARYKSSDLSGKKVNQIPKYEYRVGVDLHPLGHSSYGSLIIALDLHGFSKQYEDYNNKLEMDAAKFVDMKITWSKDFIEVFGTCTNLFDENFIRFSNSKGSPHTPTSNIAYPADGRYIGGGVSLKF